MVSSSFFLSISPNPILIFCLIISFDLKKGPIIFPRKFQRLDAFIIPMILIMQNKEIKIYLVSPRGFCAGVDRAIEIVKKSIKKYGAPVYVRHEIVHNKHVVENLKKNGAIFVEELNEIEDKTRPVIFSAHGVPKSIPKEASKLNIEYIDATCPLVSKVHREAENLNKKGFHILLIGHKNHPEVIGTMGQLPESEIDLIETAEDVENYKDQNKNLEL